MKYTNRVVLLSLLVALFSSCEEKKETTSFMLKNSLEIPRQFETISLTRDFLKLDSLENLGVRDKETLKPLVTQGVDIDGDGSIDALLFQPEILPTSEKIYEIFEVVSEEKKQNETHCFSRFVPERTDDYAWENNRVAFRTYGPTAQQMIENDVAGGTLSSGIDAWLKKVDYPIINKWYKKELETEGSYHNDDGEGLDNFHVGVSRGVGGTAVKIDSTYYTSKNFVKYTTEYSGPIRTSFILTYGEWDASGQTITEEKHISLDYGSNFSKFQVMVTGTDVLSAGLTLHENDGEVTENIEKGFVSYWEPHGSSELGTAIVAKTDDLMGSEKFISSTPDKSNVYADLKVHNDTVIFYSGFGWKESGQYNNQEEWELEVASFSKKINNPIILSANR